MVELEAPASRAELEEELTFARLELAKREVSEGNAVEEQHRLERMLRDSQRFLVEHEVPNVTANGEHDAKFPL